MHPEFKKNLLPTLVANWALNLPGALLLAIYIYFGTERLLSFGLPPHVISLGGIIGYVTIAVGNATYDLSKGTHLIHVRAWIRQDWYQDQIGKECKCLENTAGFIFGIEKIGRTAPKALKPVITRAIRDLEIAFVNTVILTKWNKKHGDKAQKALCRSAYDVYTLLQNTNTTFEKRRAKEKIGRIKAQVDEVKERVGDIAQEAAIAAE